MPFYCCPCRGIKALCCHLQHCSSSPAPDWWSSQSSIRAHTHTHTRARTLSLPYFKSTSHTIQCLLEATVYSLLTYGWRNIAGARREEWILSSAHSSVAEQGQKEAFVCICACVACVFFVLTLPECTHNKNQPCGCCCFFFFSCKSQDFL